MEAAKKNLTLIEASSSPLFSVDRIPNIAIQAYNREGEVLFWNSFSNKLFEIPEKEALGKNTIALLLTDNEEKNFKKILEKVFSTKKPSYTIEWSFKAKSGKTKHVYTTIFLHSLPGKENMAVALSLETTEKQSKSIKVQEMSRQIERFSEISAAILSTDDAHDVFNQIAQAVIDISDFNRVLISYFIEDPPYREIIGFKGINQQQIEKVIKIEMPKEKYQSIFVKGLKVGKQSCYIPAYMKEILDQRAVIYGEQDYPEKNGHWQKEDNLLVAMLDKSGDLIGVISVDDSKSGRVPTDETVRPLEIFANLVADVCQKQVLKTKVKESEEKYREVFNNMIVGLIRTSHEGYLQEANPASKNMFGYHRYKDFIKQNMEDLFLNPEDYVQFMQNVERKRQIKNMEYALKKKDGTQFWASLTATAVLDKTDEIICLDTVIEDITERKKLEEDVKRLSITDELTGLYNRRYFNTHLHEEIKVAEKWNSTLSLIMVDIDDFKLYNDSFHHLKGDEVIREVAQVISQKIRRGKDWGARFGGDEFAIVLPGTSGPDAFKVAERIRAAFEKRLFLPKDKTVCKTISLGVAECYHAGGSPLETKVPRRQPLDYEIIARELICMADKALFTAKETGKNKVVMAEQSLELSRAHEAFQSEADPATR